MTELKYWRVIDGEVHPARLATVSAMHREHRQLTMLATDDMQADLAVLGDAASEAGFDDPIFERWVSDSHGDAKLPDDKDVFRFHRRQMAVKCEKVDYLVEWAPKDEAGVG